MITPAERAYELAANAALVGKACNPAITRFKQGGGWVPVTLTAPTALGQWVATEGHAVMGVVLGPMVWDREPHHHRVVAENILHSTLIGIDFDNDGDRITTVEEALADPILSTAALIYETANSWKYGRPRFRCFWWLPRRFDLIEHEALARKMIALWHGTDKACSNPNRIFYGCPKAVVHRDHGFAELDVESVEARYQSAVEAGLIRPASIAINGGWDPVLSDLPGQWGCYHQGIFDLFFDEIGLAVRCLELIPPRRQSGIEGTGSEYTVAWRCVLALLNVFGPELAVEIIDRAGWHTDAWDLEAVINRSIPLIGRPTNTGQPPADLGTLIHQAKRYGLTDAERASFQRRY